MIGLEGANGVVRHEGMARRSILLGKADPVAAVSCTRMCGPSRRDMASTLRVTFICGNGFCMLFAVVRSHNTALCGAVSRRGGVPRRHQLTVEMVVPADNTFCTTISKRKIARKTTHMTPRTRSQGQSRLSQARELKRVPRSQTRTRVPKALERVRSRATTSPDRRVDCGRTHRTHTHKQIQEQREAGHTYVLRRSEAEEESSSSWGP